MYAGDEAGATHVDKEHAVIVEATTTEEHVWTAYAMQARYSGHIPCGYATQLLFMTCVAYLLYLSYHPLYEQTELYNFNAQSKGMLIYC